MRDKIEAQPDPDSVPESKKLKPWIWAMQNFVGGWIVLIMQSANQRELYTA